MVNRKKIENKERLIHILEAIDEIFFFTSSLTLEQFLEDRKTKLAIEKLFEIIGEAAYKIDKKFKDSYPDVEWNSMETTRHILVHNYYEVSAEILWNAKELYLKDLKMNIKKIVNELEK